MENNKPLYYVVKNDLKEKIARGEYRAGDSLPTESELCSQYDVSRITVRKAIECLEEEGIIERQFSKTPRVKGIAIPRNINRMSGLSEDLARSGVQCSNFILKNEIVEADDEIADKMGVSVGTKLYRIERLRYGNGDPLCYQTLYLVEKYCPGLMDKNISKNSIYAVLENEYNLKISECEQKITACIGTYRICALLELPEQTAMLKVFNKGFLYNSECFEYSVNYYVGSNYLISVMLTRE